MCCIHPPYFAWTVIWVLWCVVSAQPLQLLSECCDVISGFCDVLSECCDVLFQHNLCNCYLSVVMWYLGVVMCYLSVAMCYLRGVMCYMGVVMCYLSGVMCYLGVVMCYLSVVMCYLSVVMCYLSCDLLSECYDVLFQHDLQQLVVRGPHHWSPPSLRQARVSDSVVSEPQAQGFMGTKLLPVTHVLVDTWMLTVKPVYKL